MTSFFSLKSIEKLAASIAASFIPVAVFFMSHTENATGTGWRVYALWAIVLGGLAYSAPSVAGWAKGWTRSLPKAIGFTVLLEGVLVFAPLKWLSIFALCILAGINCIVAVVAIGDRAKAFAPVKRKATKKK